MCKHHPQRVPGGAVQYTGALWANSVLSAADPPWQPVVRGQSFSEQTYDFFRKQMLVRKDAVQTSRSTERISLVEYLTLMKAWPKSTTLGDVFTIMLGNVTVNTVYTPPSALAATVLCMKIKTGNNRLEIDPIILLPTTDQPVAFTLTVDELQYTYSWQMSPRAGRHKIVVADLPYPLNDPPVECRALACTARLTMKEID